jgi:hypothetical protein
MVIGDILGHDITMYATSAGSDRGRP